MKKSIQNLNKILILYNIRSAQNVGSLFRTSDAIGITKIVLVGYTPSPLDRFGRARSDIAKASLGAEKTIPWEVAPTIEEVLVHLHTEKYTVVAIEQSKKSIDYKKVQLTDQMAFVLGNEVEGIPEAVLKLCDVVAEIPMQGGKESLNVSVAGGIALFRILDK